MLLHPTIESLKALLINVNYSSLSATTIFPYSLSPCVRGGVSYLICS